MESAWIARTNKHRIVEIISCLDLRKAYSPLSHPHLFCLIVMTLLRAVKSDKRVSFPLRHLLLSIPFPGMVPAHPGRT